MKLSYSATAPLNGVDLMLMGGGMGTIEKLEEPLVIMAMPEGLTEAVQEAQRAILLAIKRACSHYEQQAVPKKPVSIEWESEFVSEAESPVLVEGAYVKLTAHVVYA